MTTFGAGGDDVEWQEVLTNQQSNLPPGMSLTSGGQLEADDGGLTKAGTYIFTVKATDFCDCDVPPSDTASFTIKIFSPLSITTRGMLTAGTAGQPYQFTFTAQGGDPARYSWSISSGFARKGPQPFARDESALLRLQPRDDCSSGYGAPPGLCLTDAGILQGTPTAPGTYNFVVQLYDNDIQNFAFQTVCVVIAPAQLSGALTLSGPVNLSPIVLGNPISGALMASGGQAPYTFAITGLPAGVTSSGAGISGTPTAPGNYSVGVKVTDAAGATVSSGINFSVFGFSTSAFPPGVPSSPYVYTIPVTGGTPPYTVTATGLPPGFFFHQWRPAEWDTANHRQLYHRRHRQRQQRSHVFGVSSFSVTAPGPLQVPGGPLTDTTTFVSTSQLLSATGGAPPYSWSVAGGTFPDGLTLRSSGNITGTPAKPGAYTFSARATDVTGGSGVGAFTINVKPQAILITTPSPLSSGMITVDYPIQEFSASGGSGTLFLHRARRCAVSRPHA